MLTSSLAQRIGGPDCADALGYYIISNQEEIDSTFKDCVSIKSTILIGTNYAGSFVLPEITTFVHSIYTNDSTTDTDPFEGGNDWWQSPLLTTLVGNGVELVANISIYRAPLLESVSFGKLRWADYITLTKVGKAEIDFSSLASVESGLNVVHSDVERCVFENDGPQRDAMLIDLVPAYTAHSSLGLFPVRAWGSTSLGLPQISCNVPRWISASLLSSMLLQLNSRGTFQGFGFSPRY